nr:unnamed protein product [Digitaria exilis]
MSADELSAAREWCFFLLQVCDERTNVSVATSNQNENRDITKVTSVERATYAFIPQTPIRSTDAHLEEFSEAMRTVAKTLRRVAEGKAAAQAEAAEWKRKYELEMASKEHKHHNLTKDCSGLDSMGDKSAAADLQATIDVMGKTLVDLAGTVNDLTIQFAALKPLLPLAKKLDGLPEKVATLQASAFEQSQEAPFRLLWGCDGDKNGQHKRDFVSFEKGDIKTAERSNKQVILLKWESPPQTVLFVTKPNSSSVLTLCAEMVRYVPFILCLIVFRLHIYLCRLCSLFCRWLKEHSNMNVFVEPRVSKELLLEDSYFKFIQTWNNGKWLFTFHSGIPTNHNILTDLEEKTLHTKVDLVVTLGGDGTVLWAASLFKGPVPPVVPFALGSLGFMTPFRILYYQC